MTALVLDAGALIALDRNDRAAWAMLRIAADDASTGALALLGAVLGTIGAYAALAAGPFGDISRLSHVPFAQPAMIALGTPLIAAVTGWLLAGREPNAMASRQVV